MRTKTLLLAATATIVALNLQAAPMGTAFTYQGRLNEGGSPANGSYVFRFSVYAAPVNSPPLGTPITTAPMEVSNGLFTVTLDFGDGIFTGANRWLGLEVHTNDNSALFVALTPLQPILPTPYAIYAGAVDATGISGIVPGASISGFFPNAMSLTNVNNTFAGDGTGLTNVNAATLGGLSASNFWNLGGNAGTTAGTHFLGTTDNQPLEIKVHGLRTLRIEDNGDSADLGTEPDGAPNLIGGSPANFVGAGVVGATIGGGGATNYHGEAYANSVKSDFGVVSGGLSNSIANNSLYATIAGGGDNNIGDNSPYATILGGGDNDIGDNSPYATILGGGDNDIAANAYAATIAGGVLNDIRDNSGWSTIGGGSDNNIAAETYAATIAGGGGNNIGTNSDHSAIGGGDNNNISAYSPYATVAGGGYNNIGTNSDFSAIGGGNDNNIAADTYAATIAGGIGNSANAPYSTVGGGNGNKATGQDSVVSGGSGNAATNGQATVSGGIGNSAGASISTVSGGQLNAIGPGAVGASIGGGRDNFAYGEYAMIPGGRDNYARSYCFAAGYRAGGTNDGTFIWSDGTGTSTYTSVDNQFVARASGGFVFYTGTGSSGAQLAAGGTAWAVISDRNVKKDFTALDSRRILEKLAALPITQWRYQWEAPDVTPHIGPMAQDFKATFYPGTDDKSITTQEADGVALAAIQGLNQKLEETRAENAELKLRLERLERLMNRQDGGGR